MAVDTDTEAPQSLAALYAQRAVAGLDIEVCRILGVVPPEQVFTDYAALRALLAVQARTYARAWTWPASSSHPAPPRLGHKEA